MTARSRAAACRIDDDLARTVAVGERNLWRCDGRNVRLAAATQFAGPFLASFFAAWRLGLRRCLNFALAVCCRWLGLDEAKQWSVWFRLVLPSAARLELLRHHVAGRYHRTGGRHWPVLRMPNAASSDAAIVSLIMTLNPAVNVACEAAINQRRRALTNPLAAYGYRGRRAEIAASAVQSDFLNISHEPSAPMTKRHHSQRFFSRISATLAAGTRR